MKVSFWGVRGSIPAPGPETNRYGGNTSCVTVRTAALDGTATPVAMAPVNTLPFHVTVLC